MHAKGPEYWEPGKEFLSKTSPVFKQLIAAYPNESLHSKQNLFQTLAHAIVGQQISVAAADAIWKRLRKTVGGSIRPGKILAHDFDTLKACGLSGRKTEYLIGIAETFAPGGPLHRRQWSRMDDEQIRGHLLPLRGIGPWTVDMVLIFTFMRPDVFPLLDIGLVRSLERHFNKGEPMDKNDLQELGHPWRPYRTVATWYLWRDIDDEAVAY